MERVIWTRITMYVKIENKTQIRLNSSGEDVTGTFKIFDIT